MDTLCHFYYRGNNSGFPVHGVPLVVGSTLKKKIIALYQQERQIHFPELLPCKCTHSNIANLSRKKYDIDA